MIKNNNPGKFIVFEGLDGSGQTTQAGLLRDLLQKSGFKVVLTKEPTLDSEAGKKIRQALDKVIRVEPGLLQELFVQDRKEHLENLVIPALKEGKIVISDRYFFSTFAFGVSDGLDLQWLIKLNDGFLLPDMSFILKVNPQTCIKRIEHRGEGKKLFEREKKLVKVWQTYKILPDIFRNVCMINGEKPIGEVFAEVESRFHSKLKL